MRAAFAQLEHLGVIDRRPHIGTRVIAKPKLEVFDQRLSSYADLTRLADRNPRHIVDIREEVVSRELAKKIQCPPGETFIRFAMVRLGTKPGDPPIAWTTEYVSRHWQPLIEAAKASPETLMIDLIARVCGERCVEIQQVVEATVVSEEAAGPLKAKPGEPCLRIFRRYLNAKGRCILRTVSYHPADRYAFMLTLRVDARLERPD